jgi:hypothetical protein
MGWPPLRAPFPAESVIIHHPLVNVNGRGSADRIKPDIVIDLWGSQKAEPQDPDIKGKNIHHHNQFGESNPVECLSGVGTVPIVPNPKRSDFVIVDIVIFPVAMLRSQH